MRQSVFLVFGLTMTIAINDIGIEAAFGWGDDGHQTIGAIADQLLKGTKAEQEVRKLLQPTERLSSISTWRIARNIVSTSQMRPYPEISEAVHLLAIGCA